MEMEMNFSDLSEYEIKSILYKRFLKENPLPLEPVEPESVEQMTPEEVDHIVDKHKNQKTRDRKRYHETCKHDPVWVAKNRERSRIHYLKNKEKKKAEYDTDQPVKKAKVLLRYYMKQNRLEEFKTKHPQKWTLIQEVA